MPSTYDQRYVRHTPEGFIAHGPDVLCDTCGARDRCSILSGLTFMGNAYGVKAPVQLCGVYVPVLSFADRTGLDKVFNTFRRGAGCYRRLPVGTKVRLFANDIDDFVGEGTVIERQLGALGSLLETHAGMNHLMRDGNHSDAEARLQNVLIKLYGKNYSMPTAEYSVVYVEVKQ